MEYCWLITHTTKHNLDWIVHIDSVHLDEGKALTRVNELVKREDGVLETITSYKNMPNSWEWWNPNRDCIITAERILIGVPLISPITHGVGVNDQITDAVTSVYTDGGDGSVGDSADDSGGDSVDDSAIAD